MGESRRSLLDPHGPWSYGLASLGSKLVVNKRIVNPKALTFDQTGGDEAGDDPPSDEGRLKAPGQSSEAGHLDVEVSNPPIGPQPPEPIVAQRDAVELAA